MALMEWKENYSVGVKAMDDQHKILVHFLNDLHAAMSSGQAKLVTGPLLVRLAKYAREHFSAEEALLQRAGYPALLIHRQKHTDLNRQVEDFIRRFETGEITLNVRLLNFLRDWLTTHIQKEDRGYGPWLNEHGVR